MSPQSYLYFFLYFSFSEQLPSSTPHASLKTESSFTPPSPSHSTYNSSSSLFSYSDICIKLTHFLVSYHCPTPSFSSISHWTIAFKQVSACPPLVCLPPTHSSHSSQIFQKHKSYLVTLWSKIHQQLPYCP